VSYLYEASSPSGGRVNSLDIHGEVWATRHWGATVYSILDGNAWRQNDLGLVYRDDCLRVEVLYRRNQTFNGTLGPSSAVVLRLSLATLGNTR
jgi:LPS-assembly protein